MKRKHQGKKGTFFEGGGFRQPTYPPQRGRGGKELDKNLEKKLGGKTLVSVRGRPLSTS